MIDARELRIGNWVIDGIVNEAAPILAICKKDSDWPYEPIPLTPEVLEKCGLWRIEKTTKGGQWDKEYTEVYYYCEMRAMRIFTLHQTKDDDGFVFWFDGADIGTKNLHQLQNLYFALTGEELNYQP